MKVTKDYTPGPWHHNEQVSLHGCQLVYGPDSYLVADAGGIQRRMEAEEEANARLIAASPELAEVALALVSDEAYLSGSVEMQAIIQLAKQALQKAGIIQ